MKRSIPFAYVLVLVLVLVLNGCASADKSVPSSTVALRSPVTRSIGTGFWQDMRIQVHESPPTALYISDGSKIMPNRRTSFDLKVRLTDRVEGTDITNSRVSAAITRDGRAVFEGTEEPTLTETGPDYENDVSLPGPETYRSFSMSDGGTAGVRRADHHHSPRFRRRAGAVGRHHAVLPPRFESLSAARRCPSRHQIGTLAGLRGPGAGKAASRTAPAAQELA